ncbi:MAG: hypothetical protein WBZ36_07525 [Candidatus Nitrosopolaris sp.]
MGFANILAEAIEYYAKALRTAETIGYTNLQRIVSLFLGILFIRKNNLEYAYNYLKDSIDLAEYIWATLAEEGHKISFFATELDAYELIIHVCIELTNMKMVLCIQRKVKCAHFLIYYLPLE